MSDVDRPYRGGTGFLYLGSNFGGGLGDGSRGLAAKPPEAEQTLQICTRSQSILCVTCGVNASIYTVSQKTGPFSLEHNFGKYCPILIILSLL